MVNEGSLTLLLNEHFKKMRMKNPAYSLRAMARAFNTSPAQLSQVLSGKRSMSDKFIFKAAEKMGLSPIETRNLLSDKVKSKTPPTAFEEIEEEKFRFVADWYHFAILSLASLPDSKADPKWIAQRLGIEFYQAKEAFERLLSVGMIEIHGESYRQIEKAMHTTNDVSSAAIRRHHTQNLELAAQRLQEIEVELCEFTSITFAANLKTLPLAKKLIRKFKFDLYELMDKGKKDEVYTFAMQLFPVSKKNMTIKGKTK